MSDLIRGRDVNGQDREALMDNKGRLIAVLQQARELILKGYESIVSGLEQTILAADVAAFHDVIMVQGCNSSAGAWTVSFRDDTAGAVRFKMYVAGGGIATIAFPIPYPAGFINDNWTAQIDATGTSISNPNLTIAIQAVRNYA